MYDTDGGSIGCLFILLLFLFIGFNSFSERHDFYELKKISSADEQTVVIKKENNSLIGQFFIGTTEKTKKGNTKIISLQYIIQTEDGVQLKDFQKEYDKDVFDDGVYFKESTGNKAKLTVDYSSLFLGIFKFNKKITFHLPKEDLEKILSRI